MSEQLFQMMRFQILSAALAPTTSVKLHDSYVFAWDELVYPYQHDAADWHKPFAQYFKVSEEDMKQLIDLLDEKWREDSVPTLYQLEDILSVRSGASGWSRHKLLAALKYLKLQTQLFDKAFWAAIEKAGQGPSEAAWLSTPYVRTSEIFFH